MHLPVAGYRRYPPRRFVFSSSAAPTAPPGSAFLASPGCHRFHLDLHCPQRWANTDSLNGAGVNDDADDDDDCCLGPPCGACEDAEDDLTPLPRRPRAVDPYIRLKLLRLQSHK